MKRDKQLAQPIDHSVAGGRAGRQVFSLRESTATYTIGIISLMTVDNYATLSERMRWLEVLQVPRTVDSFILIALLFCSWTLEGSLPVGDS